MRVTSKYITIGEMMRESNKIGKIKCEVKKDKVVCKIPKKVYLGMIKDG